MLFLFCLAEVCIVNKLFCGCLWKVSLIVGYFICCLLPIVNLIKVNRHGGTASLTFHQAEYFPFAFTAWHVTRASLHGPLPSALHVCRLCYSFGFWMYVLDIGVSLWHSGLEVEIPFELSFSDSLILGVWWSFFVHIVVWCFHVVRLVHVCSVLIGYCNGYCCGLVVLAYLFLIEY